MSKNIDKLLILLIIVFVFVLGLLADQLFDLSKYLDASFLKNLPFQKEKTALNQNKIDIVKLQDKVLLKNGYRFNIVWGNLGRKLISDGVIDEKKLAQAIAGKDTLSEDLKKYLDSENKKIELTQENAHFWLDMLWGLGLANKNKLLDSGEMQTSGDPANFASTGGYTLGISGAMNYYSKFSYLSLSEKQQAIVEEIAGNIYRPCCGNPTSFPDCNHGMAMLGLIELMVSQNFSKEEIYKTALAFNTYWFPQTYLDIAYHFEKNARDYRSVSPKEILSKTFSSAMGYSVIRKEVGPVSWPVLQGGGSCGA